eukprot:gene26550-33148_t
MRALHPLKKGFAFSSRSVTASNLASVKADRPDLRVIVVPQGSIVTMDFRVDRLRLFVDENGVVVQPPRVG